jgi:addiction module HigA family antidote
MTNKFYPNIAIPPGVTLIEILKEKNMTQTELANRTGRPIKTISEIVNGKAEITPETAIQFEKVLGLPASFWLNLQMNFNETLARIKEKECLEEQISWLKLLPIKQMIEYNWIKKKEDLIKQLEEVFLFFNVANLKGWEKTWEQKLGCAFAFRKSEISQLSKVALSAWLRRGEIVANSIECKPFNNKELENRITELIKLTMTDPDYFQIKINEICSKCGIAVVFVKELPKVPVNGVTYWLNSSKAVIQLSLRYRTDDQLWFSFFHEIGHILLHGKRDFYYTNYEEEYKAWEEEANKFARDTLIPEIYYTNFIKMNKIFSRKNVIEFANILNISPGIVVGRLQHDKYIGYDMLNDLKRKFKWAD